MRLLKCLTALTVAVALAACGGGGGSAGATASGSGSGGGTPTGGTGTSTDGGSTSTQSGAIALSIINGAGTATNSISAVEIAQARVIVRDGQGAAVPGVVVTFTEAGASLLSFAPASKTALTDAAGAATIELRAATSTETGATTVGASTTVSGASLSATKAIAISSAPAGGTTTDPQLLANALNFLDVNPADRSIVLAGSGGSGRSESATLRFRVVDTNNTPVKGVSVNFGVVPAGDVTLNIPSATSDAEGVVVTTVSSKNVATAVVVNATVATRTINSQSDRLLVTTGTAIPQGFDLSATKYNLNYSITGDSSTITVRIVDANGNPVADGVPVVFTANYGRVGTSAQGGCTTTNGLCQVDFVVQDPRPADGTDALVTASTRVGDGSTISDTIAFRLSQPGLLNLFPLGSGGNPVTTLTTGSACKTTFTYYLGTPGGFAPPAQSTLTTVNQTSGLESSIVAGSSPILDDLGFSGRSLISFEIDPPATRCVPDGTGPRASANMLLKVTTAGATPIVKNIPLVIDYPTATPPPPPPPTPP